MPEAVKTVGRYEILRELGRGGMATVHLARQRDLDRLVALKELGAFHAADPSFAQRFVRESRVAGSLSHPNIVTVHDYFEHDGTPYIAMEYVEGGSLRPWVGRMTLAQRSGVFEGILAALTVAESQGIVHRDLKPENVMVSSHGLVKIADFGIAKATTNLQTGGFQTATGVTIGTPNYMAPEQAMGQQVGPWTDLYSLGCMAFELFVGRVPFHDTDAPMAILMRHINDQIPPVRAIDPSIDPEISDWIQGLLSKDPAARTGSAAAAWDAYEEIADRLLPRRWHRESRLTGKPGDAPVVAPPPPFTPPPADLPSEPMADEFETYEERTSGLREEFPSELAAAPPAEPPAAAAPPPAPPVVPPPPEPEPSEEAPAAPPPPPPAAPPPDAPTTALPAARSGGRGRLWAVLGALAVVVVAIVAALALSGGSDKGGGEAATATPTATAQGGGETAVEVPGAPNGLGLSDGIVWVSTRDGTVGIKPDRSLIESGRGSTQGGRTVSEHDGVLWVPIPEKNQVAALDASTGEPRDPTITTSGRPKAITVAGNELLVSETDGRQTWVQRYDTSTGAPGARINVANGVERIILRGDTLWVLTADPDLLHRYDATIGTRLSSTEVGDGAKSMVVSDGVFWVTGSKDGSLTRVDEETQESKRFELGGSPQNVRAGLDAIWVTNATKGALQEFDPTTGDVRDIPVGERPFSLVLAEDGIWVGDTSDNRVRFVKP
jgi:serine/threonine protein kinase